MSRGQELENEAARRSQEVMRQYRTADYQTAKSALQEFLQFLDKASADPNASPAVRADAMITCVRLAKLEEKQGHRAEQAAYMKQAVARCQAEKLKLHGCVEESLRREVDRMDALTN